MCRLYEKVVIGRNMPTGKFLRQDMVKFDNLGHFHYN